MNKLLYNLSAGVSGLIFGIGLLLSGMTNPKKVTGFLDVSGNWDPSLAFVMIGAISIGIIGFQWIRKYQKSLFQEPIQFKNSKPSVKVVIGSLVFGVGWGITGICPGPGIVNLGAGSGDALIFILGLVIGIIFHSTFIRNKYDNTKQP